LTAQIIFLGIAVKILSCLKDVKRSLSTGKKKLFFYLKGLKEYPCDISVSVFHPVETTDCFSQTG